MQQGAWRSHSLAKAVWLVGCAAILLMISGSIAAQGPLARLTEQLTGPSEPVVTDVLPEPADLQPGWWNYFAVSGDALDERIKKTVERLGQLQQELPAEAQETASPLIELSQANLLALPQARRLPSPDGPPPPVFQERYTVDEILAITRELGELRDELTDERLDVEAADAAVKAIGRRVDTLLAAYLNLDSSDPKRVLKGLEIMAERTEVSVAHERLRVRLAGLQAKESRIRQMEDKVRIAIDPERLAASYKDLITLNAQIEQAETRLKQAQERYLKEQTAALGVAVLTPEERATAQYRQQRVARAAIAEAIASLQLIRLQAEKALVNLFLDMPGIDTDTLRGQLANWQTDLDEIRNRLITWTNESERERDRTGTAVAKAVGSASVETEIPEVVRLINQDRFQLAQETLIATTQLEEELGQMEVVLQLVDRQLLIKDGYLRDWLAFAQRWFGQLWDQAAEWVSMSLFRIGETPVTALGLLRIVLIVTVAWWISYWLRRALMQLGERREGINLSAYYTVGRLSHYVLIALGILVGLSSIGMDFTNFALIAGALGIGIGFGLQPIVNNFLSGLILLFERSLKVGDFVELSSGVEGEVREINVRSTLINTNDNVDIVVPNSEFMNTNVINWTLMENYRRIHLPFRVAYGTDKELVRQAGLEAAEKVPHTLSGIPGKNPGVWLVNFGDSGLEFELVVWITHRAVKRPGAVHAAYLWEIDSALRKYNVDIPFPQRDIHIRSGLAEVIQNRDESVVMTTTNKPTLEKETTSSEPLVLTKKADTEVPAESYSK